MRRFLCLVLVCAAVILPSGLCQDSCRVQDGKPGEKGVPGRDGLSGQKGEKGEPSMYELLMALKHYHITISIITVLSNANQSLTGVVS